MNTTFTQNSRFKLVPYSEASQEVQNIYDDTKRTLQLPFVLNWFKCQGSNATLLEGNWTKLKNTLVLGDVPNILKQMIIYKVSKEKNCDYCTKAHGIFADSMSGSISDEAGFKVTENLDSDLIPNSYKVALEVVSKAAINHQGINESDFQKLKTVGFNDAEIQELMAQADLVNMLNTIADVSGIKIDNELVEVTA